MIKQHLMLALIGTALVATPALAQSQSGSSSTMNPPAASAPAPSSATSGQASASGSAQFISQAQTGQWRASKLVGVDIYGTDDAKIGSVSEVLLDKDGKAQAIVIGVGGFLGVGAKDVALPFNTVQWKEEPAPSKTTGSGASTSAPSGSMTRSSGPKDYPDHGVLNMTKDQLKNAPEFKYASDMSKASSTTGSTSPTPAPRPTPMAPAGSTGR